MSNISIWSTDRIQSGAITSSQSGPGSYDIKGVLRIPQRSSITAVSPSDCLVSYPGDSLGMSLLWRAAVGVFHGPGRQDV